MPSLRDRVFISYRVETSEPIAFTLFHELAANGYQVFVDKKRMSGGKFLPQIKNSIEASGHFVLVLAPDSLDSCNSANDILRKEIETALSHYPQMNIVPFCIGGFDYRSARIKNAIKAGGKKLQTIPDFESVFYKNGMLNEAVSQLLHRLQYNTAVYTNRKDFAEIRSDETPPEKPSISEIIRTDDFLRVYQTASELSDSGKYIEAIDVFTHAITLVPNYSSAYNNRGFAYYKLGKSDQALEDYKLALYYNHYSAYPYNNIGVICLERNELESAETNFNLALAIDNHFSRAYFNRAKLYMKQGLPDLARESLDRYSEYGGETRYGNTLEVLQMLRDIKDMEENRPIVFDDYDEIPF